VPYRLRRERYYSSILSLARGWEDELISSGGPFPLGTGVAGTSICGVGLGGNGTLAGITVCVVSSSTVISWPEPVGGSGWIDIGMVIVDDDGPGKGLLADGVDAV
jgi:hypothetical protein